MIIFNDEKIRNDKEYYRLVVIIHIMSYYPCLIKLKEKNWNFNFADTGNYSGLIVLITISLIMTIIERRKGR